MLIGLIRGHEGSLRLIRVNRVHRDICTLRTFGVIQVTSVLEGVMRAIEGLQEGFIG